MLTVNHFEIIRRKVLLDGLSQRDVARELGHSRKTVAKAMEHHSPPGYRMGQARVCPVMDGNGNRIGGQGGRREAHSARRIRGHRNGPMPRLTFER